MGLLTASSFLVCLLKDPRTSTLTHPLTHPTLAQRSKNVNSGIKKNKNKPSPHFCRDFCCCDLFIAEIFQTNWLDMDLREWFSYFCCVGESEQSLNISFEKTSSALKTECCMHEYAFSFINEELNCS